MMSRVRTPRPDDARATAQQTRLARGFAAGALATFVALFSHVGGGGTAPGLLGVGLPLLFAVFISVLLAGGRLSLLRLALSVGLSQTAFHWIFDASTSVPPGAGQAMAAADPMQSGLHAHHSHVAGVPADFASAVAGHAGHAHGMHDHSSPGMFIAHLIAALITTAVLYRSEVVLRSILDLLRLVGRIFAPATRIITPVDVDRPNVRADDADPASVLIPLGVIRSARVDRGPPVRVLTSA